MNSIQSILSDYKYKFENLSVEVEQKKRQLKASNISSSVFKNLLSGVISDYLPVTKTNTRKTLDQYGVEVEDPYLPFRMTFNKLYQELENVLKKHVIVNLEGNREGKKLKSYITSVKNVVRIDTKLRHVLDGLDELILIKDRIQEKSKLVTEEKTSKEYIKSKGEMLWESIKKDDISSFQYLDENEYFDRKEKLTENTKSRIEELLVALTNTKGGIIVFGIDDNKKLKPLKNKQRDAIQNQITSLCCDRILEPIQPKFHSIITSQDEDIGLLCIFIPKYTKHHHCTSGGKYLWRIGSNNKPIPPGKNK